MIARAVVKTEAREVSDDHKALSESMGLHNLTELRQRLEEKMVLTVNAHNRPADQQRD